MTWAERPSGFGLSVIQKVLKADPGPPIGPSHPAAPLAAGQPIPAHVESTPHGTGQVVPDRAVPVTQPPLVERQENAGAKTPTTNDKTNINEVVLLVHGIRDFGEWEQMVSNILEEIPGTKVPPLSYGRFDALRFWFPIWTRDAPVRKLLWRIRSARDRFPSGKLSVIAHSFGTYAIGKILRENPDIRLHRLVLCGAILPSDFRWDQIRHSVETEIINDCGIRDIWPVLAQSTTFGYGPSGRFGFGTPGVRDRYHDFGHGGFFKETFVSDFWLPWFRSGNCVKSKAPPPSGTRWHILTIIQIKWLAIVVCALGISWFALTNVPIGRDELDNFESTRPTTWLRDNPGWSRVDPKHVPKSLSELEYIIGGDVWPLEARLNKILEDRRQGFQPQGGQFVSLLSREFEPSALASSALKLREECERDFLLGVFVLGSVDEKLQKVQEMKFGSQVTFQDTSVNGKDRQTWRLLVLLFPTTARGDKLLNEESGVRVYDCLLLQPR